MVDRNEDEAMPPELLASWKTPAPLTGFVERVVRGVEAEPTEPTPTVSSGRRLPLIVAFAAGVAAAALVGLLWGNGTEPDGPSTRTPASVAERSSFMIGEHATAVAEADAILGWDFESGHPRVQQRAGAVFYRVDPDAERFVVATAHGDVVVHGTCFTVRVRASGATVRVHEGDVELRSAGAVMRLGAGEQRALGRKDGAYAAKANVPPSSLDCPTAPACEPTVCDCSDDDDWIPFPIPAAELESFVDECRVVLDAPPLVAGEGPGVTAFVRGLELSDDEATAFRTALKTSHNALLAALGEEYFAWTGESADRMPVENVLAELQASATELDAAQVRQRIAVARAAGNDLISAEAASPFEQAYRHIFAFGDAFERELAKELGPERARTLRESRGGWDGERLSETGCP